MPAYFSPDLDRVSVRWRCCLNSFFFRTPAQIPWLRLDMLTAQQPTTACTSDQVAEVCQARAAHARASLAPVYESKYDFTLTEHQRRRGIVSMGDRVRFRRFVQRLAVQEPLKVGEILGENGESWERCNFKCKLRCSLAGPVPLITQSHSPLPVQCFWEAALWTARAFRSLARATCPIRS